MNAPLFLCNSDDLTDGRYHEFPVETGDDSVYLIVTRHQGRLRAWYNVCPHQGRALNFAPDRFITDDDGNLVCCAHGAVFEPDCGRCIAGPCRNAELKAVAISEMDGRVSVKL